MRTSNLYIQKALGYRAILLQRLSRGKVLPLEKETIDSHEVLYQANNVFPFELFPDTVTIDRVKFTMIQRYFFFTAQVTSLAIEDILHVAASVGPFFGSLKIWSRVFAEKPENASKPIQINFLSRKDAMNLGHILQGLIIANRKRIDTSQLAKGHLLTQLKGLGSEN